MSSLVVAPAFVTPARARLTDCGRDGDGLRA